MRATRSGLLSATSKHSFGFRPVRCVDIYFRRLLEVAELLTHYVAQLGGAERHQRLFPPFRLIDGGGGPALDLAEEALAAHGDIEHFAIGDLDDLARHRGRRGSAVEKCFCSRILDPLRTQSGFYFSG